ncbi:MAG: PD40 domain-containing protein [Methanophagales archaeon]|nr:PD40 domain-containing protein [Methanophagales archaeon]
MRSFPACSPDGKKIAFVSNRDGDNEIYVMDADGTNVRQLTNNTADEWGPDWCWASTVEQMELNSNLKASKFLRKGFLMFRLSMFLPRVTFYLP